MRSPFSLSPPYQLVPQSSPLFLPLTQQTITHTITTLLRAAVTPIIKTTQLPSIPNSTFTESTTQLVILAAAESAITIIAASIPILRALIRDSRPPPGPAQFYHSLDFSLYTGAGTGTGTVSGHNGESGDAIQRPGSRT